jgi:hypothetical protein
VSCRYWHFNDGDGLDAAASRALADALQVEIDSGRCAGIERERPVEAAKTHGASLRSSL